MIDKAFHVAAGVGAPIILTFLLIVIGNLFALFLTQIFFPLHLKKQTLSWERMQKAEDEFLEAVSRVYFIARGYIESEHKNRFSFAGLSLKDTEQELSDILQRMHKDGHRIRPHLSTTKQKLFDKFIRESSVAYDDTKDTYGNWYQDDHLAEEQHSEKLIATLAQVAEKILPSLT